jgi:hypothetical protein
MNVRELAEADLGLTLEDTAGAGSSYVLICGDEEFEVTGSFGDIGYLLNPNIGTSTQTRTITATYRIKTLREKTEKIPERGWRVRAKDLQGNDQLFFVVRYEPDYSIGIGRITLGVKL